MPRTPEVLAFAQRIKSYGFRVFIAASGEYGFITDQEGARVLQFSFTTGFNGSLGGCYGPPSSGSGTGWRMDQTPYDLTSPEAVTEALYARPPLWAGDGWRYLTTLVQYLAAYDASSRFEEVR